MAAVTEALTISASTHHVPYLRGFMYPISPCTLSPPTCTLVPYLGPLRAPRKGCVRAYADQGGHLSRLRLSCQPLSCRFGPRCHPHRLIRPHPSLLLSSRRLSCHHPSRRPCHCRLNLRRPRGWHGGSSCPSHRRYRVRCSAPAQRQRHPRCPCNLSVDQDHLKSSRSRSHVPYLGVMYPISRSLRGAPHAPLKTRRAAASREARVLSSRYALLA